MEKIKIDKIFTDLDGVIFDFDKRYAELYGILPKEADRNKSFRQNFDDFIKTGQFATLELMPGAIELLEHLEYLHESGITTVEILSSTAYPDVHEEISKQKLRSLEKYMIEFKPNLVPGKRHKAKFATPKSILIDDHEKNISQWREAGGIGIRHLDHITTIKNLETHI